MRTHNAPATGPAYTVSRRAYENLVYFDSTELVVTISAQSDVYDAKLNMLVEKYGTVTLVRNGSKSVQFNGYYNVIVNDECSCSRDRERNAHTATGIPSIDRNIGKRCMHVEVYHRWLNEEARKRIADEEKRREDEVAALKAEYPVVGYQVTRREVALVTLLTETQPDAFISNGLLAQAMNAPLRDVIRKAIDKLRQEALSVTTSVESEVA